MNELQQDVLRLQAHMIPALRLSFRSAIDQLADVMSTLRRDGNLNEPWLGDEVSAEVAAHYARRALDDPDSSYQALVAYRDELLRVHDTLQRMEDEYRRNDGDDATRWGLMA